MLFEIRRRENFGPNIEIQTSFDPSDPLCSPGIPGALFTDRWVIELEDLSDAKTLSEKLNLPLSLEIDTDKKPVLRVCDERMLGFARR